MNEINRYRITGALFIVALAAIVLPMLFDGEGLAPVQVEMPDFNVGQTTDPIPEPDLDNPYLENSERLAAEISEDGYSTSNGTRIGEPVLLPPDEATEVWAVQAGSFAAEDNARSFRDELREQGFEAFLSSVKTEERVLHRVAVGPLLSVEEARGLRDRITSTFEVQARLMAFST